MSAPHKSENLPYPGAMQPPAEAVIQAALPPDRTFWLLYRRLRNEGYPPEQALVVTLFHWQENTESHLRS